MFTGDCSSLLRGALVGRLFASSFVLRSVSSRFIGVVCAVVRTTARVVTEVVCIVEDVVADSAHVVQAACARGRFCAVAGQGMLSGTWRVPARGGGLVGVAGW